MTNRQATLRAAAVPLVLDLAADSQASVDSVAIACLPDRPVQIVSERASADPIKAPDGETSWR